MLQIKCTQGITEVIGSLESVNSKSLKNHFEYLFKTEERIILSLDKLIKIATSDLFSENILEARNERKANTGNVFEDDKTYESKMGLLLDWYIFSRIDLKNKKTILEVIIDRDKKTLPTNLLKAFEGFTKNIHGIFMAKK